MERNYRSLGNILSSKLHFSSSNRSIRIASIILSLIFLVSAISTVSVYDIRSPEVTVLSPQDGEYVSGEVEIIARVQSPRAIDQVLVSFDEGSTWEPMCLSSSRTLLILNTYKYVWETSTLPDNTYNVMISVLDVSRRMAVDQIQVIVENIAQQDIEDIGAEIDTFEEQNLVIKDSIDDTEFEDNDDETQNEGNKSFEFLWVKITNPKNGSILHKDHVNVTWDAHGEFDYFEVVLNNVSLANTTNCFYYMSVPEGWHTLYVYGYSNDLVVFDSIIFDPSYSEQLDVGECTTAELSNYYIMILDGNELESQKDIDSDGELEIKGGTWGRQSYGGILNLTYYAYSEGSTITGHSAIYLNYSIGAVMSIRPDDGQPRNIAFLRVIDLNDSGNIIWQDAAAGLDSSVWYWNVGESGKIDLNPSHHYVIRLLIVDAWSAQPQYVNGSFEYVEINYDNPPGSEQIDVCMPNVNYESASQTIDITSVTAICSNPDHEVLDNTEATTHTYTVYTNGGSPTSVTGNLVWTGSDWQALDIDVSSLSNGDYYVLCYFEDSDLNGMSGNILLLIDEGTEGHASEYSTWQGMTVTDADPGSTKLGSQSLRVQKTSTVGYHSAAYRPLSTSFQWGDFVSCTLWIYRPSGHFTDPADFLHFGFLESHDILSDGQGERIIIGSQPADTWVQYTITKAMLDHVYYGGLSDSDTVVDMFWRFPGDKGAPSDVVYVDGLNIKIATSLTTNEFTIGGITPTIDVSMPSVSYSSSSQTIDITGVTATCSNSAHGELDDTEATIHTYTVYTSGGSPTSVTGDLSWTGSNWQALDVDVSPLSNGDYYVRCNFADSDATGTSSPSNIFAFDDKPETIDVSTPLVVYDDTNEEISIIGVIATCSNPAHGELDSSEATLYEYKVKTSGGSTVLTGDLLYLGDWFALFIDVSSLSDGTYYVKCYFECSDGTGSSEGSNTFTIGDDGGGDGNGGGGGGDGNGDGDSSNGDGGDDGGSRLLSCILDFLTTSYSSKPGETVTLAGTISTNTDGQLIAITFESVTYEVYTTNNGEFQVTVTAPDVYGVYEAKAKFAGDSNWKSASATCQLLVVEEETQMSIDVQGNLANGEQVTISVIVTTENGDPVVNEKVTIYIYEWKTSSSSTNLLSIENNVKIYAADVRYWELIDTIEVTTDENGSAVTTWTVSTDNNMQIVAEFSGIVEGEGGVNIGSSTAIYGEEETYEGIAFLPGTSTLTFGVIGGIASAIIALLVVVMKTDLITRRRRREELVTVMETKKTCASCGAALTDDLPTFYCLECGTIIEEEIFAPPEVPEDQIEIAMEETVEPKEKEEFIPPVDIIETPVDEEAIPTVEKERRCTYCRGILFDDPEATFCPDCGAKITKEIIFPPEVPREQIELVIKETVEPIEDDEQEPPMDAVETPVEEEAISIAEKERRCASCGNILLDDPEAKFCPDCGAVIAEEVQFPPEVPKEMPEEIIEGELTQPLEKEYRCKQCGRVISNLNVKFCPDCGTQIQPK